MLRCDTAQIVLEDRPTEVGFFTTRAVDADNRAEAIVQAMAAVRADLRPRITNGATPVGLDVEDVAAVSWWWRRLRPPAGFTFFLVKPDEWDSLPGPSEEPR